MKQKRDTVIIKTNLGFLIAFVFLGVFIVAGFMILDNQIQNTQQSFAISNFMESQYSLIQKTTFLAAAYAQSMDLEERKAIRTDVHEGLKTLLFFNTTSNDIVAEKTHLPRDFVPILRKIYTASPSRLNPAIEEYCSQVKKFLLGSPVRVSSDNPNLLAFKAAGEKTLLSFRATILAFHKTNNVKIVLLKRVGIGIFISHLACLALVGLFVFLPTVRTLTKYLYWLKNSNLKLEAKVAERTAELEQKAHQLSLSNEELKKQIDERIRAEKELRESNAFLDSIIENIPHMIFIKDAEELRFVRFNQAGENLVGHTQDEMLGKNDYDFFPKEQADFFKSKDKETLGNKTLVEIAEEPIVTPRGTRILHTKKIPILSVDGRPVYLLGISEDITERIQAEQQLRELSMAMENAMDGIARLDPNLKFLNTNRAYVAMLGYNDPQELVGLNYHATICPEDQIKVKAAFEKMRQDGKAEVEAKVLKKEGAIFNQYTVMVPTFDKEKNFIGCYCFAKDITEQKYQESLEIKSELIQMVSHELRTPIHSINEGISIVLEGLTGNLTQEQKEVLSISKRCVERLVRLVNDVLAFHKFEAGVVEFQMVKTDLNRLIEETVATMRPLIENKGLKLELELKKSLPHIELDRDKIIQVLTNFLQNAIKFTNQGAITVASSCDSSHATVSVKDTGIGIQQKDIPKLFRKFGQLEAAKVVAPGGTGLGLAISKKIIDEHHGKIEALSEYKKGSSFSFILPREQTPLQKSSHKHK